MGGVIQVDVPTAAPEQFRAAVAQVRDHVLRPEVSINVVPAPVHIAPWALAMEADVARLREEDLATGRFVLLHDPDGQAAWEGTFRAVTFVRAVLEPEMAEDPLLSQVTWEWLRESLADHGVPAVAAGGTVTRVLSQSFGSLADRPSTVDVEMRASWTVEGSATGAALAAWEAFLCTAAGLPPLPVGVSALPHRLT
jgi:hypothetical protein